MQLFDLRNMLAPFFMYLLQAVQIPINVFIRGPMVNFQVVPQLPVDLTISLTLGQDILQSLGEEAIFVSKNDIRVDRS